MFKTTKAKTPQEYLDMIDEPRKSEMVKLHKLICKTVPKLKPFIIAGMIGYGPYHYKSKSGREGDWALILLASQKNYISVHICALIDGKYLAEGYTKKLPKTNIGKSCIRFKKIEDIDLDVLSEVLKKAEKATPVGV